jgi:hypothetical protein
MRFAALIVAALPLAAPAADTPAPIEDLFPLAVGNTWTYKVANQEEKFVVRVARQEMVGEQTCFVLEGHLRDRIVATEHLAFTKDGLTRFRADKEDVVPPVTFLKAPGTGQWPAHYQLGERSGSATFRGVSNGGREVTVPAGRFRAINITADVTSEPGTGMRQTQLWYARGVGLVRQTIGDPKRPPFFTMDLEKFEKGE